MSDVGFVGLGRMGFHMASHLVRAGFAVAATDISTDARERAEASGIQTVPDLDSIAGCGVVMSSLPTTTHVEDVYVSGLFPVLPTGAVCVDLSTISVDGSIGISREASAHGITFLDAPVSGTSIHAEAGTLAIMVGGPSEALERVRPMLESFSAAVHHMGPNGAGLEMKLITNRLLTAHVVAIGEAVLAMEAAGLDVAACIELLKAGAVPKLLDYKAPAMAARDYSPLFTVELMSKDLRLAAERRPAGQVTEEAVAVMLAAEAAGHGPADIAAVMEILVRASEG
jgi:3-hydroxyisobutyrate dehydrogenase-like beta-hydroxyacid dehydrogenase